MPPWAALLGASLLTTDSPLRGTQISGPAPKRPLSHDETWLYQPAEMGSVSSLDIHSPYPPARCSRLPSPRSPLVTVSCPTKQMPPRAQHRLSGAQLSPHIPLLSTPAALHNSQQCVGATSELLQMAPSSEPWPEKTETQGRGAPVPHTDMCPHSQPKPPCRSGETLLDQTRVYLGGRWEGV